MYRSIKASIHQRHESSILGRVVPRPQWDSRHLANCHRDYSRVVPPVVWRPFA
jgi:hypothetical protein